jgi:hypothetical protein
VLSRTTCQGQWSGVNAEAVEWRCANESTFNLTFSRYRLGFVLEQSGGYCETRVHPSARDGYRHHGRPFFNFSPPDMQVWACSDEIQYTRSISLTFRDDDSVVTREIDCHRHPHVTCLTVAVQQHDSRTFATDSHMQSGAIGGYRLCPELFGKNQRLRQRCRRHQKTRHGGKQGSHRYLTDSARKGLAAM